MPAYGVKQYWEDRYTTKSTFDWYVSLEQLRDLLTPLITPESPILNLGCGNSRLSQQLYEAGYRNVVNVDFSEVVIDQMREQHKDMPEMQWVVMDCTELDFPDGSFDLVIDKGTSDAMFCGNSAFRNVYKMNRHILRLLRVGGHFVVVTYGQPDTRICHLRRKKLNWVVEHKTVAKPVTANDTGSYSSYHIYIMTKCEPRCNYIDEEEEDDDDDDDMLFEKFADSAGF